jgi:hypothetical protein
MGDGDEPVDIQAQRHIESCLACQAEVTRYQKMFRALGELRTAYVPAPAGLLEDTLAVIDAPSRLAITTGGQKAAVAGAVGAVAAGAAATLIVLARRRGVRVATVLARA